MKKPTYKEIKSRQKTDLKSKSIVYDIYRNFSTPFTYFFIKLGISANSITILSIFLYLIGGIFLTLGTYFFFVIGLAIFIFNRILDDCDGEIARLTDSRSVEGVYLDRVGHYVLSLSLGMGFGLGLYRLYNEEIYLALGFIFTLVLVLDNVLKDGIKSSLRENILKIEKKRLLKMESNNLDKNLYHNFLNNMFDGKTWNQGNIVSKIIGIYPFQGLIYTETFIIPLLLLLTLIEQGLVMFVNLPEIYGYVLGLMAIYILIISISKSIWLLGFIYKIEKKRSISRTLKKL